jgi:UDP-N-acetylglucosamine--N-acetylmuramyl-(pentapeptide) pyrophosphoryl-undecaprenol N-acetylglucosamine transferase
VTFLFVCGGTGGHIFPARAVAEELEKRSVSRVLYACAGREIENDVFRGVPREAVFPVSSAPYRGGSSILDLRFLLKLAQGYFQSRALLKKLKPTLVVGFGGYVSFPVLLAAKHMGFRTVLHEQNVVPGRANRLLAKWTGSVALSFEESCAAFPGASRLRVTGNPIRASIEAGRRDEALSFFGFSPTKKTLLVLGGSQGAESINRLFLSSIDSWNDAMKQRLQVLHLCGRMDPAAAENKFRNAGVQGRAFSFFERMDRAYAATDLCLGRAGATFLAEIDALDLPALLVPYPYGDGHQRENARVFAATHRARVAEQWDLTAEKTIQELLHLLSLASVPPSPRPSRSRAALADFLQECAS